MADYARAESQRIAYTVAGRGPVCLVPSPGWGFSCELYRRTLRPLRKYFRLVFMDSRGCGLSSQPRGTKRYRYADFARDMEAVRRRIGAEKVWIFGHSHAGVQAQRYALDFPERAAGLLLIGTYAETDAAHSRDVARRTRRKRREPWFVDVDWDGIRDDRTMTAALEAAWPLYFHDVRRFKANRGAFAAPLRSHAYRGWIDSEGGAVHLLGEISAIRCPTLLIVGDDDFVCSPMHSRRIARRIRQARLEIIARAGHFPWLERPRPFYARIARFLRSAA